MNQKDRQRALFFQIPGAWKGPGLARREGSAEFSPCGRYRYALKRRWAEGAQVLFVMLNPSTADAARDDPTIRRCLALARAWGFGALAVGNLFAFRTPCPQLLRTVPDPVGPDNDAWLRRLRAESALVVAAWGNHGSLHGRDRAVRPLLEGAQILGFTRQGRPRHPLYLPGTALPRPWD